MKSKHPLFLEAIKNCRRKLGAAWSICVGAVGLFSTVYSTFQLDKSAYIWTFIPLGALFLILSAVMIIFSYKSIAARQITIDFVAKRKLSVMRGDFQDNMDFVLRNNDRPDKTTCFAIGLDRSGALDVSTAKGILHDVVTYLKTNFNYTPAMFQEAVKNQINNKKENPGELNFGDILCIKIDPPEGASHPRKNPFFLLLIANSQKTEEAKKTGNIESVEGPDSRTIILKIFDYCQKAKYDSLVIGAMGTNGLQFPYKIIIAEIVNAFAYCCMSPEHRFDMVLSVRSSDMEMHNVQPSEIIAYLNQAKNFYRSADEQNK